jgi:hypothetical protein
MDKACIRSSTRTARRGVYAARQALWLALALALPGGAQNGPPGSVTRGPGVQPISQRAGGGLEDIGNADPTEEERRLRTMNAERHKLMVADTNKLLKLASELNAEISREKPDSLTPAQLRKVAEIEKLARSVKEKMSTSVRGTPVYMEPQLPQLRYPQSLPLF